MAKTSDRSQDTKAEIDLPEPHVVPPALRKRLQECFERAGDLTKQDKYDHDHVHTLLAECVVRDPGNAVYVEALLENLQRKYKNNKKGARLGGFGGKGNLKKALAKKDWKEVLKVGPPMLKTNPWDVATLRAIAEACEAHGYNESELRWLKNALDANPKDADVNRHCARSLARMGQFQQAIVCWHRVEELKKNDAEARDMISLLTLERNRNRAGIPADPKVAEKLLGKYALQRALAAQKAAAQAGESPDSQKPAETSNQTTEMDEADAPSDREARREIKLTPRQTLEQAIRDNPANVDNYLRLASLFVEESRLADAERVLAKGLEASGNDLQVREHLEDVQILRAKEQSAIADKQAAAHDTEQNRVLAQQLRSDLNRLELEVYGRRAERYPQELSHHFKLGSCLKRAKNYAEAIKTYQNLRQSPEYQAAAALETGECLQQLRQFSQAVKHYRTARKTAESGSEVHKLATYREGVLLMGLKEWQAAEKRLRELAEAAPDYKDVQNRLDKIKEIRQTT